MLQIRNSNHAHINFIAVFIFCLFAVAAKTNAADDGKFDRLLAAAQETGAVRIIVGVKIADGFAPEGDLPSEEQAAVQRAAIRQAQENLLAQISNFRVADVKQFEFIPFLAFETDAAGLTLLKYLPDVTSISEDMLVEPTLAESLPIVGASAAWNAGATGQGWAVAILDTGVDKNHEFLSGKVVSEACYGTNDPANGRSSLCPGGVTATTATNSGLPCDGVNSCDHGTHVAGIAAGRNGDGNIDGVAKDANIIAIKIFSRIENCNNTTNPCLRTFNSDIIRGLERVYALRNTYNIAAANMSLGGGQYFSHCDADSPEVKAAIDNLRSAKIATVISSGNDAYTDSLSHPACISTAVSVGSTNDGDLASADTVSGFSNSASFLDLLAPGSYITSSVTGNAYGGKQGTSMSAPHVTGAWAALKDRVPFASVSEVLSALVQTGQPITDTRNNITKPRIRVDQAVYSLRCENAAAQTLPFDISINGSLSSLDCLENNSRRDIYKFNGTAGQQIRVTMQSNAFDTRLYLYDSFNHLLVENDDFGGDTHSRILPNGYFALPATTTYYVIAAPKAAFGVGQYQIILEEKTTNLPDNGELAFHSERDGNFEIFKMNADGSGETLLSNNPATDRYPIFSPDGRRIAFQSNRDGGNYEIYMMNSDGTEQVRLTNHSAVDEATGFSPDGSKILFQTNRDGNYEIYSMNTDGSNLARLTNNTSTDADAKFSPDGNLIVFRSRRDGNNEIYKMTANGIFQTRLTNDGESDESPIFSPDGSRIAFHSYRDGNAEIYLMYSDGDNLRRLTFNSADDTSPVWSPDSGSIAFHSDRESAQNDVFIIGANGGTATRLTESSAFDGFASWQQTPTGIAPPVVSINDVNINEPVNGTATATFTVTVEGQITNPINLMFSTVNNSATAPNDYQPIAPTLMTLTTGETTRQIFVTIKGDAATETAETFFVKLSNVTNAAISKSLGTGTIRSQYKGNGKIAFASERNGNREIYTMTNSGSLQTRLTNNAVNDSLPKFSLDGSKIIFDSQTGAGDRQLFTMNDDGTNLAPLTNLPGTENYDASFSPDNSKVVFTRIASGNLSDIYTINADGSNLKQLTTHASADVEPRFSSDGTKIIFSTFRHRGFLDTNYEIYVMNADGSGQTRLTNHAAVDVEASFSPDGRQIVFASDRSGDFGIYMMNSDGTSVRRVTNNNFNNRLPSFSPDGGKILFQSLRGFAEQADIYSINPNGADESQMTSHVAFDGQASWQPKFFIPTAASVSVGGRVSANKRGVARAFVNLLDTTSGEIRTAMTNPFGYYRFDGVPAGKNYLMSVRHKQHQFEPRIVTVNEDLTEENFTALGKADIRKGR